MFNFNIITAEQTSVDPYRFYNGVYGQVLDYLENFPIDSMLTRNDRCCTGLAFLLNNHIKNLNRC